MSTTDPQDFTCPLAGMAGSSGSPHEALQIVSFRASGLVHGGQHRLNGTAQPGDVMEKMMGSGTTCRETI